MAPDLIPAAARALMSGSFERIRVLIVEDNAHMSTILRTILQGFGVRTIVEVRDAADAFETMRDVNPDFALVDYMLGDLNGLEFTRLVRTASDSANKYLPIIMVTGHTDKSKVLEAINAGVNEYLAKPVRPVDLFHRISALIERPRRFVKASTYFGPDRRRRQDPRYNGPWRRSTDEEKAEAS
jgi:DNA-binding response OmpR family regulator